MLLLILTYGRPNDQPTYDILAEAGLQPHCIAASAASAPAGRAHTVLKTAHVGAARAAALQYAREQGEAKVCLLDDDLRVFSRTVDNKFTRSTPGEVRRLFVELESALDDFAHAGVMLRFMGNHAPRAYDTNRRYIKLACYNTDLIPTPLKFRLRVHEDIDAQLQLASQGLDAYIETEFAIDDHGQYRDGGCQRYRTPEVEEVEFNKLRKHHPDYVNFVNGRSRVSWAKAYKEGKQ